MRIAVLHSRLSPYFLASFQWLQKEGTELLIHCYPPQENAPFDDEEFAGLGATFNRFESSEDEIFQRIQDFQPHGILVSGWIDKGYLKICRLFRKTGIPVIGGCDTQWSGTLRQRLACLAAPYILHSAIDVLWVPGKPQGVFANKLGYRDSQVWSGLYTCDWHSFNQNKEDPHSLDVEHELVDDSTPFFLFVGRYVEEKGLPTLIDAYHEYQKTVDNPWQLVCAGNGPLKNRITNSNAIDLGFVQPCLLPGLMASSSCFILPSLFEPWGVVLHEAATTGLPLIATETCGAGIHLLEHKRNGYRVPPSDVKSLATAMSKIHHLSKRERESMAHQSHELSKQYTPEIWSKQLLTGIREISG